MPQLPAGPELAQLQQMIQANPQLLPLLLQQIAQADPQLSQALSSNPEAFMRVLNNPQAAAQLARQGQGQPQGQPQGQGQGQGQGQAQAQLPQGQPQQVQIRITDEEKQAIDNLERLGFSRRKAIEAFLICDKNEELAANYLFDHRDNDEQGE